MNPQRSVLDDFRLHLTRILIQPAQQRLYAGQQLADFERLRHIIIRAKLQTDDFIDNIIFNGQQNNPDVIPVLQLPAHIVSAQFGHHHIKHNDARTKGGRLAQRLFPVTGGVHLISFTPQRISNRTYNTRLIIDYQHLFVHQRFTFSLVICYSALLAD
jgi:hypothetical protein